MQDRQHINNDPLVDRGWAQMQAQLDEVMPVRKRRVFPWWVLFLSIGIISSLGAYGWGSFYGNTAVDTQNEQKIKTTPLQEKRPIAQIESKEIVINTKNNTNTENTSNTTKTLPVSNNTSSILQEKVVENQIQIQSNQGSVLSTQLAQEENKRPVKEAMFSNTASVTVAENTLNVEPIIPSLPKRTIDVIAALETAEIGLLKENAPSIETEIDFSATKKSHLIIEAGTETGFGGNPQGGSLGLAYQHRINNKMAYEIGLSYQAVSIDLFSDALSSKSGDEDNRLSSQEFAGFFRTLSVAQAYNWLYINKINLNLVVDRKINTRWAFSGGAQISYYTKATIPISNTVSSMGSFDQLIFDDNSNYNLYDESIGVYPVEITSNNINITGDAYQLQLKRWQLSALLRAHYRISKHWEIEANYRKALTKWPDNKNTYGSSSFVGLGLRYYLW